MELQGRVALVTGATGGLGAAICRDLAAGGAKVLVSYRRSPEAAEALAAELGQGAAPIRADLSTAEGAEALFAAVDAQGDLDILVNNAGITRDGLMPRMSDADWFELMDVNLHASFRTCRAAAQRMMMRRTGSIINIASISAVRGNAGQANYAASKAAVVAMTKCLAKELARRRVRVNAVAPGFFDTPMTQAMPDRAIEVAVSQVPMRRMGKPEELSGMVRFLAGPQASYITGQLFCVDGGLTA